MITYITGDLIAAAQEAKDIRILVHLCNNIGVSGAGIIVPIFKTWPDAANLYHTISSLEMKLGNLTTHKSGNVIVVNLIGQEGVGPDKRGEPPVRYWSIEKGFRKIRNIYDTYKKKGHKPRVIAPRLGCALAGGKWPRVLQAIHNGMPLGSYNLDVYTLEKEANKFPNTPLRDLF